MGTEAVADEAVIQFVHGCIVAPVQTGLAEAVQDELRAEILLAMEQQHPRAVIVDVGGVGVLDSSGSRFLCALNHAIRLMGTQMVLTGLRAEQAAVLVDMDIDLRSIRTARTIDAALRMM
jgi:rsbT co-antagonist protein RsbR